MYGTNTHTFMWIFCDIILRVWCKGSRAVIEMCKKYYFFLTCVWSSCWEGWMCMWEN